MSNKIILLIIFATFFVFSAATSSLADDETEAEQSQTQTKPTTDDLSPIPVVDVEPIDTKSVVIVPFGTMQPPTKESVEISRGVEVLLTYYLDFFYKFSVESTVRVTTLLTDIDLPKAPGVTEARKIAKLAGADYVIFGNVSLSAPDVVLKGSWFDVEGDKIMSYVEETGSISMLLRVLTNFSRQLAYAPSVKFDRGQIEKNAEKRMFCKYINTFRFYVQAYMHYMRNEIKETVVALDKAILLEPDFVRALIFKADIVLAEPVTNPAEVTEHFARINMIIAQLEAVQPETTSDFRLFWKLGNLVFNNGKLERMKAHDLYLKSFLLRSNWLRAYFDIIYDTMPALMSANKYYRNIDNIFNAAKQVQEIFPGDPDAKFILAMIYWKLGHKDNAVEVSQEITESHPEYLNAFRLLVQIKESKEPHLALEFAHSALSYHPFNYSMRYQTFLALFKTAFMGMNLDDDDNFITLDELRKVNNQELPNKKKYNIYKGISFGFKEKYFPKYDVNKDEKLDQIEFIRLLADYGYGPVERTNASREGGLTGINIIADELWHHALICYALRGLSGPGIESADLELLKAFINADTKNLERHYDYERIYIEIASDETMNDYYNIDNPLSNLLIYWGLAKNFKSYKSVAMQIGKKFLEKRETLTKINTKIKKEVWMCPELNLFMYPDRSVEARFAPKDLPVYDFGKKD